MPYFEYCTVLDIRNEGIAESDYSDARVLECIRLASVKINLYTDQWFQPVIGTLYLDGDDTPFIKLPDYKKFIKVSQIEIISDRSSRLSPFDESGLLPNRRVYSIPDQTVYEISNNRRMIEFVSDPSQSFPTLLPFTNDYYIPGNIEVIWPEGRQNLQVEGVFGWLDNEKELTAIAQATAPVTQNWVEVDSVDGWEAGDVAAIYLAADDVRLLIVTDIDTANTRLVFAGDKATGAVLRFEIPAGTEIKTFGQIPMMIKYCTKRLAILALTSLSSILTPSSAMASAIVSEKVDNYSYTLNAKLMEKISGYDSLAQGGTGDPECDSILQAFIGDIPPYFGTV